MIIVSMIMTSMILSVFPKSWIEQFFVSQIQICDFWFFRHASFKTNTNNERPFFPKNDQKMTFSKSSPERTFYNSNIRYGYKPEKVRISCIFEVPAFSISFVFKNGKKIRKNKEKFKKIKKKWWKMDKKSYVGECSISTLLVKDVTF